MRNSAKSGFASPTRHFSAGDPWLLPRYHFENSMCSVMFQSKRRDLFPGALELMVLQTLDRAPLHGYALAQSIQRASAELLQIEEGSLYPALQRMLKAGWLESAMGVSAQGRSVRIYRLTDLGKKRLVEERQGFETMFTGIHNVLTAGQL